MEKFIPYQKLSKKKQRELDRKRRGTWGGLNPVTRTPANSKAYNRQKARRRNREDFPSVPFYAFLGMLVPIPEFQKELMGRGSYRRYQREVKQGIAGMKGLFIEKSAQFAEEWNLADASAKFAGVSI